MNLNDMTKRAYANSIKHGFWDQLEEIQEELRVVENLAAVKRLVVNEKLALIHSELSEALEEVRIHGDFNEIRYGKLKPPEVKP